MNDKFSIITILSVVLSNQLFAAPLKYGHQLAPNQTLNLNNAQIDVDSDPDTIDLYGVYYNNANETTLNADATQINVTNNNTGTTLDNYQASAIYSNTGNSPTKASVNLGNASQLSATADAVSTINLTNSKLSASNITIVAEGKYHAQGIVLDNSEASLLGNNKIVTSAGRGVSLNKSSLNVEQLEINLSGPSTTNNQIYRGLQVVGNSSVNLGSNSIINVDINRSDGIYISDGDVIAKDLTINITGLTTRGVAVHNGSFTMEGGSVTSSGTGVVIGGISPEPPNLRRDITLTDVEISANSGALSMGKNGTLTLNRVIATSRINTALSAGENSVTTATDTVLKSGDGNVVSASADAQITFSGNTEIISTDPDNPRSSAIRSSGNGIVTTGANGSQMQIVGDLTTLGNDGIIDLEMNTGSHLTGQSLISGTNGIINLNMTDSVWDMTGDSTTTQLTLNNTAVNFTDPNYATLTTNQLAGNGFFTMHTDIASQQGDLIIVTGNSAGSHALNITNQGTAETNGRETLTVVETTDGNADFRLANQVEAGGYLYNLRKASNDTDWELYGLSGSQSSSALAGASFLNTSYLLNYVDNQTLLQRLGDLRVADASNDGFWLRSFGGKLSSFSGSNLAGFDMPYWGTQLGIDKGFELGSGRLVVGTMVGITQGNTNYRQGDGTAKNYSLGFYSTYYQDNGFYIDALLKYNNIQNRFSVKDSAGLGVKGKARTHGVTASVEAGKRLWLSANKSGFYLEPQAQLSVGTQGGDTVKANNGLNIKLDSYNSTLARASAIIGYQTQGDKPINIYLKSGYVRELSGNTSYRLNGNKEKHSFRGGWWDNGIGISANLNKVHNLYMEATYAAGSKFDQKQLNLGYRYNF